MILENLRNKNIILGSGSPRRKELLSCLNHDFEIRTKQIDESYPLDLNINKVAEFIANKKSDYYTLKKDEILITADTVVICNKKILGKPKDEKQATEMLVQLSSTTHKVMTGVCIRSNNKKMRFSASTYVSFNQLEISEIQFYIDNYKPFDKAGSYGIQDWIGQIGVKKIEGCFYNVVGLPISKLLKEIKKF